MTGVRRTTRIDHGADDLFAPPGHARFDLYAWAEPRHGVRINAGLLNLGDRRYWDWSSVRGLGAQDADLSFHTRPGRSVAVNVAIAW